MLESGKTRAVRAFVTASPPRRPDADLYRRNAAVAFYPRGVAVFWHAATRRLASFSRRCRGRQPGEYACCTRAVSPAAGGPLGLLPTPG